MIAMLGMVSELDATFNFDKDRLSPAPGRTPEAALWRR